MAASASYDTAAASYAALLAEEKEEAQQTQPVDHTRQGACLDIVTPSFLWPLDAYHVVRHVCHAHIHFMGA